MTSRTARSGHTTMQRRTARDPSPTLAQATETACLSPLLCCLLAPLCPFASHTTHIADFATLLISFFLRFLLALPAVPTGTTDRHPRSSCFLLCNRTLLPTLTFFIYPSLYLSSGLRLLDTHHTQRQCRPCPQCTHRHLTPRRSSTPPLPLLRPRVASSPSSRTYRGTCPSWAAQRTCGASRRRRHRLRPRAMLR